MDPRIVHRALQGDAEASRLLEAELRATARLLLCHEALGIEDRVTQRVLANAAVSEALERELRDADSLMAATMMAAARRAVEHQRRSEGEVVGTSHLPPGILVSMALVPQVLAAASRSAAEQHLVGCADCTEMARRVRDAATDIIREQEGDPEEPTGPIERTVGGSSGRSTAPLGPPSGGAGAGAGGDASDAAEAMLQRMLREADAVSAGQQADPKTAKRFRRRRRNTGEPPLRSWPLVLTALVLCYLVYRMQPGCEREQAPTPPDATLADLAHRELPVLPARGDRAESLEPGFLDLEAGDCAMGAKRFHLARLRKPELAAAWYWEGLAFMCAGEGTDALDSFRHVGELDPEAADLTWYTAQAALLAGDGAQAEFWLRKACSSTTARVGDACAQLARMEAR